MALSRRAFGFVAALTLGSIVGCGSGDEWERVPATGTIAVDGTPAKRIAGTLILVPMRGTTGPSASAAIAGGAFAFDAETGPVPGTHDALIQITGPSEPSPGAMSMPAGKGDEILLDVRVPVEIPAEAPYRIDLVVPPS